MGKAVKVGDIGTQHDGFASTKIISGSLDVIIEGQPAARVGDALMPHAKPNHPPHPRSIKSGSKTVIINAKPAAITGGAVSCGGVTIGSGTVFIGDDVAGAGADTETITAINPLFNELIAPLTPAANTSQQISSSIPGQRGIEAAKNAAAPSDAALKMAAEFADVDGREAEYRRIGQELIDAGNKGAGKWFQLAADQVDAIDRGFEGIDGAATLLIFAGDGAINAMDVVTQISADLSAYNFQNYLDLKKLKGISGLENTSGKALAIEMAAFEQQIAQRLLTKRLQPYGTEESSAIINNINERFNGWFDRFSGNLFMPDSVSNTIQILNEKYPNQDFDFNNQQHRFNLATGLIERQYNGEDK